MLVVAAADACIVVVEVVVVVVVAVADAGTAATNPDLELLSRVDGDDLAILSPAATVARMGVVTLVRVELFLLLF